VERSPQKATRELSKRHNRRLVLNTIYDREPISRADIARVTRLTRTTVSGVVGDLIQQGLVEEVGWGPSEGGKPPVLLRLIKDARHVIGIDLASDEFRGAVVNLRGEIRHRASLRLRSRDGETALARLYDLVDELLAATGSPVLGIGIGTPGLMDPVKGEVRQAVNLDWRDLPLRTLLHERCGLPVYVANDCQVAAMAEFNFGVGPGSGSLVVIKIEQGIGAGIVLDGRLFHGDSFGAGEIGHIAVVEDGERCRCGNHGCLETLVTVQAIVRQAQAVARNDPSLWLHRFCPEPELLSIDAVCCAVQAGDEAVAQVVRRAGRYLGWVAASLVAVLSVQRILIAGGVTGLGDTLLDAVREEMVRRSLAVVARQTEVAMSRIGPDIVNLGACALVLTHELGLLAALTHEM
jgi:glucokinase-like ROK family protein